MLQKRKWIMGQKTFISIVDNYFKRFTASDVAITDAVSSNLSIIIVIPSFNEKNVVDSVKSLFSCHYSGFSVEIIVVVNYPENSSKEIVDSSLTNIKDLDLLAKSYNSEKVKILSIYVPNLPQKHAGVGWARKIGMDEGLRRFKAIDKDGILVGFDADSKVESNYFIEINNFFKDKLLLGASIHFEHPIDDDGFSKDQLFNISCYELHLRYYKNALKYSGVPYSFHTVGSSFAVRSSAYAKQGGMNRRKAGEDFYFINKIIQGGCFGEINSTKVIPSPRMSNRVPFGTGRAMMEASEGKSDLNLTYSFKIFELLKTWIELIELGNYDYNSFPQVIKEFITEEIWLKSLNQLLNNTNSIKNFKKRFFAKYDAFWMLKFIHFARDNFFPDCSLIENVNRYLSSTDEVELNTVDSQLKYLRTIDMYKKKGTPKNPF